MIEETKTEINFSKIEKKWQKRWEDAKIFEVKEDSKKKKYYVLEMYPYPSATGLHVGHAFNYTLGDIYSRFKRMSGFNVLYPMGYDSFGLPAENAAIKAKSHPKIYTDAAIANFITQQKSLGLSYDWSRIIQSHDPEYYKWDQHFFLQFLKKGLAYKKKSAVNFCPKCNSVLANEQVHQGKCWVHKDIDVEIRHLDQWFLKTTAYANELLDKIKDLDWPDRIKTMQENWIGKSTGTEILFEINKEKWSIFTTRADTAYGVTFMVISAQHPRLMEIVTKEQKTEVESFLKKIKSTSEKDVTELEKEGAFTGSYAINPVNGEKIPVWTGNFVVADYGSGMVMAVPAHDQRDFEFAKKYDIPIKEVIRPEYGTPHDGEEIRKTITAIVQRKSDKNFLMVRWKKFGWIAPVIGGIDEGENPQKSAEREVLEETGYKVKAVKLIGKEIEMHFFAENKNVWRDRIDQAVLLKLEDENQVKVNDEESDKLQVVWMDIDELLKKMTHEYNKIGFLRYLKKDEAYTGEGKLIDSSAFSGLQSKEAIEKIAKHLEKLKLGKKVVQYKLRDWLLSRQRFWGCPIPIIYCDKCGVVPVPKEDLPILLPKKVEFGEGNPLSKNKEFLEVKCPKCKGKAKRETDTMDTFFDSSWYFLRFTDPVNKKSAFDEKKAKYWMPIDFYVGGAEHACMHLIYARFFTKVLRDMDYLNFDEPFKKLFNQGMIHAEDGFVMSKSRGNVVDPLEICNKYGADSLRLFIISMASPDKDSIWSTTGIESIWKFLIKSYSQILKIKIGKSSDKLSHKINRSVKDITQSIEKIQYNLAVINIRELFDSLETEISKEDLSKVIRLLSPFCPHTAEELWELTGNKGFVSLSEWPTADESKINEKFDIAEKAIEKTIGDIQNVLKIIKEKQNKEPKKVYLYVLPNELENYIPESLQKRLSIEIQVFAVNDKNKYDPESKSSKAKPQKPGIYVE